MGTTAREDISTTKKELVSSKGVVFAPRTIQFAHQFVGSETSLNMLSLTTPSLLSGNGFVNASPQEIAGANLSVFGKNLKLSLSRGLELKPYVHYLIANNNIVFIGSLKDNGGALTDEILFGEIQMAAGNAQIVGDVRFVRGTVEVAVGQTLVNLGERFKVNENPASQIGDVKIKRNGVGIYRNVGNATASLSADGNYQEMDSGTGYGVSITLNEPPIGQADLIEYEIGVQLSSGDLALWDQFQRLQGSILALSQDAAEGFYGDTDYSRYLSVSPSDLDRKAFGDLVVAQAAKIAALETPTYVNGAVTFTQTVTADTYIDVTGTTINLPAGQWELIYSGLCYVDNVTGGALTVLGNIAITDSLNTIMDNALSIIGVTNLPSGGSLTTPVHLVARVSGGIYKLRIRCTHSAASGHMSAGPITYSVSLTDPDTGTKWYAKKVGV